MVGERRLIDDIDNIESYIVLYDSVDVLRRLLLDLNVIKRVNLIYKEIKGHTCRYLKTMGEDINLTFHARVVIE